MIYVNETCSAEQLVHLFICSSVIIAVAAAAAAAAFTELYAVLFCLGSVNVAVCGIQIGTIVHFLDAVFYWTTVLNISK